MPKLNGGGFGFHEQGDGSTGGGTGGENSEARARRGTVGFSVQILFRR